MIIISTFIEFVKVSDVLPRILPHRLRAQELPDAAITQKFGYGGRWREVQSDQFIF